MDGLVVVDFSRVAAELKLKPAQVESVTALLDEGNTIPFITRYRKERTGNLDEERIRQIQQQVQSLRQLAERIDAVIRLIDAQGKLTPELRKEIEQADSLKRVEDLYLPFRPKRRTRATQAKERGLEPLADTIWNANRKGTALTDLATPFVNAEKEVPDAQAALQGASDILAERFSEDAGLRNRCRRIASSSGAVAVGATKKGQQEGKEFQDYFEFEQALTKLPPHRVLAINRGEKLGMLKVKFNWDIARAETESSIFLRLTSHPHAAFLQTCVADALGRLIEPSLERELRKEIADQAEAHAVAVFAQNLRQLLLQPPLQGQRVLAIDPGFRTGCKLAVLDEFGQHQRTSVMHILSADQQAAARQTLLELLSEYDCNLIAIGNGTACRETEEVVSELIRQSRPDLRYIIVNEAGASIYSASTVGREEFPDEDATVRGTISIGRRLQDPLSELVKIEPQHIGVGMYQHDINPNLLKESLEQVVESCVNYVGVDLNTASVSLLKHVSGLNSVRASRISEWRQQHGPFRNREQLLEVSGIGDVTFTQAAGFLRIAGGDEPLDATSIHPESYPVARAVLERLSIPPESLRAGGEQQANIRKQLAELKPRELAGELHVGVPTLQDILSDLQKPGRDPREGLPAPIFKQGVLKLEDLTPGMELQGTVLNVVDFGAFVDIGVKNSGLVHISQLANRYVRNPQEVVAVGDVVKVWVISIDHDRGRVSLTMVKPEV